MNKLLITILLIFPYLLQSQSRLALKIGYDRLFYRVNNYFLYTKEYDLAYFYENKEKNSLIDVRNYFNIELGWNYKRLFLNTGFYTFQDVFDIRGRKSLPNHSTSSPMLFNVSTLRYKEKRTFLGGNVNIGINVLPTDLNSELIFSVGAYFDKSISYKVEEDYVFKQYNYNHITDESSSTEESDIESEGIEIYRGGRFRTFLSIAYNYHFLDNWVAGINIGFNPNTEVTRHYFNRDKKLILYYRYDLFVGLKLGYTFPMKEK